MKENTKVKPSYVEMCRRYHGEPKVTAGPVGEETNAVLVHRDGPMDSIKRIVAMALLRQQMAEGYDHSDDDDDFPEDGEFDSTPLATAEVEANFASQIASKRREVALKAKSKSPPPGASLPVDSGGSPAPQKPVVSPKSSFSSSSPSALNEVSE